MAESLLLEDGFYLLLETGDKLLLESSLPTVASPYYYNIFSEGAMGPQKNVAGQRWIVFAFDRTTNVPKTGDAANISAKIAIDGAAAAATNDVAPTELEDGYYAFDLTQAEVNADRLWLTPESSTADIQVIGVPAVQGTVPAGFSDDAMRGTDSANTTVPDAAGVTPTAVENAAATWDRLLTGATHNIKNSAGRRVRQVDAAFEVHDGTSQGGGASNTFVMDTGASATDNIYRGDRIIITEGLGVGEHGIIVSYTGATKIAVMSEDWVITPDNTSLFEVVPADVDVETWSHVKVTGDGDWAVLQTAADAAVADLANGTDGLSALKTLLDAIPTTAMRGTDSANTTVPDAAGTAATLHGTTDALVAALNDLTSSQVGAAFLAEAYEGAETVGEFLRGLRALTLGNTTGLVSGTGTATHKGLDNSTTRVTGIVDANGNKIVTIVDLS